MKLITVRFRLAPVIGAALLVGAIPFMSGTAGAADEKKEPKVSAELAKTLKAAQDALNAKKYSEALGKLKEAEGNAKKTPYDQHVINELEAAVYAQNKEYAEAAKAFEAQLNDGFLKEAEVPQRVKIVAQLNYQLKNYDKAIEYGSRAIRGGYADAEMTTLVGQAYYLKGDWKGTLKFEEELVKGEIQKGTTPKKESLELILSSCVKLDDNDCTTRALERLVSYYPKPEYWQNLLYSLRQQTTGNEKMLLQTYRLMYEVDVLKRPEDYTEMAELALDQGSPGEAQHVLERAFQKNVFADQRMQDKNKRLLETAKKAASNDLAGIAKVEKDAAAAPNGDKAIGVGLGYLGYQQYDKAVQYIGEGVQKGNLKVRSDGEAHLLLGIAQLKAGHREDAVKAFHAVKGDPTLERLGNLWALHAKQA